MTMRVVVNKLNSWIQRHASTLRVENRARCIVTPSVLMVKSDRHRVTKEGTVPVAA